MEPVCTAFSAHMAMLMARGDESGIESLTREFVRANGAAEPEQSRTSEGVYIINTLAVLVRTDWSLRRRVGNLRTS